MDGLCLVDPGHAENDGNKDANEEYADKKRANCHIEWSPVARVI
jgi:hypothetical protein